MDLRTVPDLDSLLAEHVPRLEWLRQNRLLNSSSFARFAKERGLEVFGASDVALFHDKGWLLASGVDGAGHPMFHPFYFFPLHLVLRSLTLNIVPSSVITSDNYPDFVSHVMRSNPSEQEIGARIAGANRIINLAAVLEPLYWPTIVGHSTRNLGISDTDYDRIRSEHVDGVRRVVSALDPAQWREVHGLLRSHAAEMDDNDYLYLLLRVSSWDRRKALKGSVSGALWIRHIAEVIRRGFEAHHPHRWEEEDQGHGQWFPGARQEILGADRPLDDVLRAKHALAFNFGLATGSVVRWYLEGETEYGAMEQIFRDRAASGIELVNLRGIIATDRDNIALKLQDWLAEDLRLGRFSFLTIDADVKTAISFIRRQVLQDSIVGFIDLHRPDFEFANFSLNELVEVAARFDDDRGAKGDQIREADWRDVGNARAFEERYRQSSERRTSLKGVQWGAALATYALENPNREDTTEARPMWEAVGAALRSRMVRHTFQREKFTFDPQTFKSVERVEGTGGTPA